ncbi:AtpZ/AtpI family protein [Candidatus Uhrbacteria bacterium]|nr:AtpZ/AtpI family protein [Candidatus Uhrbacteria bacterium]
MTDEKVEHNSPQPSLNLREGDRENGTWSALSLAWELGYTIAVPLVVLALGGRWLDRRFETSPWLLLVGIGISLVVSSWLVYFKMMKIISKK